MGLREVIEELKEQEQKALEEEAKAEEQEEQEAEEVEGEEVAEEQPEEKKEEEPVREDKKEEIKEPLDNEAWFKMRREAAAARRKAEEEVSKREALEARLAELERNSPAAQENSSKEELRLPEELLQVVNKHKFEQAEREFVSLENDFKRGVKDYEAVSGQYANALAQAIRIQNPRLSSAEIAERTKNTILSKAANFASQGYDPVQEIYHEAKELGFGVIQERATEEAKEKVIKPDLSKVAANRARSANMASASGKSESLMTLKAAEELTNAEWMKLPNSEKRRLMYGSN